jgi:hypothetical protein
MALDDPKFRPAVRRTLKAVVVLLWTPIALLAVAMAFTAPIVSHARQDSERNCRIQVIQFVGDCARSAGESPCGGVIFWSSAGGESGTMDSDHPDFDRLAPQPGITYEFASADARASASATTWIVREHVPDALAPPLALFADGHVASLER